MNFNNAKPSSFARIWTLLLLSLLTACIDIPLSSNSQQNSARTIVRAVNVVDLLRLHNNARIQGTRCRGRKTRVAPALSWNNRLSAAAQRHAQYLAKSKKLSHRGKHRSSITNRIEQSGYQWLYAGENIAYGQKSNDSVMRAWLASKSHCANIMNDDVTEMGAAFVDGYWVAVFARPKNQLKQN